MMMWEVVKKDGRRVRVRADRFEIAGALVFLNGEEEHGRVLVAAFASDEWETVFPHVEKVTL